MKTNKIFSFLLCGILLCCSILTVEAKDNNATRIQKKIEFTADNINASKDDQFKQQITQDGNTYTLQNIDYDLIKKTPVTVEKESSKTIDSDPVPDGTQYTPKQTITDGDITYKLDKTDKQNMVITEAYNQEVSGYTDYDQKVSTQSVPATKQITVKNNKTGAEEVVTCSLTGITPLPGEWEDTYIDITFVSYDSQIFNWNGITVSKSDSNPLNGYEGQLLTSVGASADTYRVTSTHWTGDTYTDADGTLCRDARANVQRFITYYRANYSGSIYQDEEKGSIYKVTYKGIEKIKSATEFTYNIKATANYELKQNTVLPYVLAGVGVVLVLGAIAVILWILSKKKKDEEEE